MGKEISLKTKGETKIHEFMLMLNNLMHLSSFFELRFDGKTDQESLKRIVKFLNNLRNSRESHEFVYGLNFSSTTIPENELTDFVKTGTIDPETLVLETVSIHHGKGLEYHHFDYDFLEPAIIDNVNSIKRDPKILITSIRTELQMSAQRRQVYIYGTRDGHLIIGREEIFRRMVESQPIVTLTRQEADRMKHDVIKYTSFIARGLMGELRHK